MAPGRQGMCIALPATHVSPAQTAAQNGSRARLTSTCLLPRQVPEQQHYRGMAGVTADPAALLRVYLRHGRLLDAAQLATRHLQAATGGNSVQRQRHCKVWLPYQHISVLHGLLVAEVQRGGQAGSAGSKRLQQALEELEAAAGQHLGLAQQDSGVMAKSAAPLPGLLLGGTPALGASVFG